MWHEKKARIMDLFFEEPSRQFQIRQISRILKIAHTSVKNYLGELAREGFLKTAKTYAYKSYISNQQNRKFKIFKQIRMLQKLYESGLVDFLEEEIHPKCIILFGSVRKGEYTKTSDIDLFIHAKEKTVNLKTFEKKLKHKISLFFEEDINNLSNELYNNIINGIKLSGYLKIK